MIEYENAVELEERINAYFDYCDEVDKPYTKTGLARFIDIGRQNYGYYLNHSDESIAHTMNSGLERVIESIEERSIVGKTSPAFGSFWLTNADGDNWKNKQSIEQKTVNIGSILEGLSSPSSDTPTLDSGI